MRPTSFFVAAFAFICLATAAHAGPRDFMIYAPGMGGSAAQAKPYLEAFFKFVEKRMGWPEHSGTGEYVDDPKAVGELQEKLKPGFALVPPSYFLELACKKVALTPVVASVGIGGGSSGLGKFHVVIKKGGARTLEELKGKKLSSNHLQDPRFVSRLIFDDKLDAEKFFQLEPTNSPVKPFKAVDRGEASAALVDDAQLAHMKTLPFGASLEVLYSSPPLPPFPLVAFDKVVRPAERDALRKALIDMCSSKEGAETCKSMTVSRFAPIDTKLFQSAAERYCRP